MGNNTTRRAEIMNFIHVMQTLARLPKTWEKWWEYCKALQPHGAGETHGQVRPWNKHNTTPHMWSRNLGENGMEIRLHFEVVHLTGGCWMSFDEKIHRKDEKGGRKAYSPAWTLARLPKSWKRWWEYCFISQPHGAGETTWTGTENPLDKGRPNPNRGHFMIGRKLRMRAWPIRIRIKFQNSNQ